MKNAKRILEKFCDVWKQDIYESNKSIWTQKDDNDVNEIIKVLDKELLNQQASEQTG